MTPETLAYAAGLFDGEGHIAITHRKGGKHARDYERYDMYVELSQKKPDLVLWLKETFGGHASLVKGKRSYDRGTYERWDWVVTNTRAAEFLASILPYLKGKHAEATLALEFQATMSPTRKPVPDNVIEFRRECHQRIRDLRKAHKRG